MLFRSSPLRKKAAACRCFLFCPVIHFTTPFKIFAVKRCAQRCYFMWLWTEYSKTGFLKCGGFVKEKSGRARQRRKKAEPTGKSLRIPAVISNLYVENGLSGRRYAEYPQRGPFHRTSSLPRSGGGAGGRQISPWRTLRPGRPARRRQPRRWPPSFRQSRWR